VPGGAAPAARREYLPGGQGSRDRPKDDPPTSQEVLDPGAGRAELIPGRSTSRFPPAQPTSSFFPYERRWQQVGQDRSEIRVRRRAVRRMRPTGRTPSAWERGEDAADGVSGVGGL